MRTGFLLERQTGVQRILRSCNRLPALWMNLLKVQIGYWKIL